MNEIANYAEHVGADIRDVANAMGFDPRIGREYLRAGVGYGGGCLSKDVRALIANGKSAGYDFHILPEVETVNHAQIMRFFERFHHALGGVGGRRVALWGLTFKAGTDDVRSSPAFPFIAALLEAGATVVAFDPLLSQASQQKFSDAVTFADDAFAAVDNADALVVLTESHEFRDVDFVALRERLRGDVLADGRGIWREREMPSWARYITIGVDN
jgi:UDPglucose 6-dehydrogenase